MFFIGDVLRHVTQYISNCPSALGSTLPYDEASLVAKIAQHLITTESSVATASSSVLTASKAASGSNHNSALFLNLHEQLKASVSSFVRQTNKPNISSSKIIF